MIPQPDSFTKLWFCHMQNILAKILSMWECYQIRVFGKNTLHTHGKVHTESFPWESFLFGKVVGTVGL